MRPDERLIIFAHARSGSTSLKEALVRQGRLRLLDEPFSKKHADWSSANRDYVQAVSDGPSLDAVLEEIFAEFDGLKTLTFQLTRPLNRSILLAPERRIIFLRRRNLLRAVVSVLIAEQTGIWERWEAKKPVLDYYQRLGRLPLDRAAAALESMRSDLDYYAGVMEGVPSDRCMRLYYEDLFLAPAAERQAQLDSVFAFLDLDPLPAGMADRFIDPAQARLNSDETYALVPNLREIDEALGSDEYGRLFDR